MPDSPSTGSTSSGGTKTVVPTAVIPRFTCTAGHPLGGLYVLVCPTPTPILEIEPKTSTLLQVMDEIKAEESGGDGGEGARPRPPLSLGVVDAKGYLNPVVEPASSANSKESHATAMSREPDSYKLVKGQSYDFYFVHHPDEAVARSIKSAIESGEDGYGSAHSIVFDGTGIVVPEDPQWLIPAGSDLYDRWCLFRDSPFGDCPPFRQQVAKLHAHLGALRYIVGSHDDPYRPAPKGAIAPNEELFDVRTMIAVYRFQKDARTGAFQVEPTPGGTLPHAELVDAGADHAPKSVSKSSADNSWAYLDGHEIPAPPGDAGDADGVVSSTTAEAIGRWLDAGLRKPGPILVAIDGGWTLWVRVEAAQAWTAWNAVVAALGFSHGVKANHTFRDSLQDIGSSGYGRAVCSIHKGGLAIDVGLHNDYTQSRKGWPVVYAPEHVDDRIKWRIYGPSTLGAPEGPDGHAAWGTAVIQALQSVRQKFAGSERLGSAERKALDAMIDECRRSPQQLHASLFRASVRPWRYDQWHPEGGTEGDPLTAAQIAEDYNERLNLTKYRISAAQIEEYRSILDITAVAARFGLSRINAYKTGWYYASTKDVSVDYDASYQSQAGPFWTIAQVIGAAGASQADEVVTITRKGGKSVTVRMQTLSAAFHEEWMKAMGSFLRFSSSTGVRGRPWYAELSFSWSKDRVQVNQKIAGVLRSLGSHRLLGEFEGGMNISSPAGDLGGLVGSSGRVSDVLGVEERIIGTGTEWASFIETIHEKLEEHAPANRSTTDDGRVRSAKPGAKSWRIILRPVWGTVPPTPSSVPLLEDLSLVHEPDALRTAGPIIDPGLIGSPGSTTEEPPPFASSGEVTVGDAVILLDDDVVTLPGIGHPIGMEWWHYQRSDLFVRGGSRRLWKELLDDLGIDDDCLARGPIDAVHQRQGVGYSEEKHLGNKAW